MKQFKGYAETQSYSNSMKLPVGGYVLKIMQVKVEEGQNGNSDRLVLAFDIAEGEYKDFYAKQYKSQQGEDKKWKGTVSIYIPKDDGSEADDWSKKRFKTIMENFEDSNAGYKWTWNEETLKGKLIGGLFGMTHTVIEGKNVSYVSLYAKNIRSVSVIRDGNFKIPDDVIRNNANNSSSGSMGNVPNFDGVDSSVEEEIPFI